LKPLSLGLLIQEPFLPPKPLNIRHILGYLQDATEPPSPIPHGEIPDKDKAATHPDPELRHITNTLPEFPYNPLNNVHTLGGVTPGDLAANNPRAPRKDPLLTPTVVGHTPILVHEGDVHGKMGEHQVYLLGGERAHIQVQGAHIRNLQRSPPP